MSPDECPKVIRLEVNQSFNGCSHGKRLTCLVIYFQKEVGREAWSIWLAECQSGGFPWNWRFWAHFTHTPALEKSWIEVIFFVHDTQDNDLTQLKQTYMQHGPLFTCGIIVPLCTWVWPCWCKWQRRRWLSLSEKHFMYVWCCWGWICFCCWFELFTFSVSIIL